MIYRFNGKIHRIAELVAVGCCWVKKRTPRHEAEANPKVPARRQGSAFLLYTVLSIGR